MGWTVNEKPNGPVVCEKVLATAEQEMRPRGRGGGGGGVATPHNHTVQQVVVHAVGPRVSSCLFDPRMARSFSAAAAAAARGCAWPSRSLWGVVPRLHVCVRGLSVLHVTLHARARRSCGLAFQRAGQPAAARCRRSQLPVATDAPAIKKEHCPAWSQSSSSPPACLRPQHIHWCLRRGAHVLSRSLTP